jgi:glutaredoxin
MLKMYTTGLCPDCRRAKRLLEEQGVAYEEVNIEAVEGAAEWVAAHNQGKYKVPTFDHDGHVFACSPYNAALLRRELGLSAPEAAGTTA